MLPGWGFEAGFCLGNSVSLPLFRPSDISSRDAMYRSCIQNYTGYTEQKNGIAEYFSFMRPFSFPRVFDDNLVVFHKDCHVIGQVLTQTRFTFCFQDHCFSVQNT